MGGSTGIRVRGGTGFRLKAHRSAHRSYTNKGDKVSKLLLRGVPEGGIWEEGDKLAPGRRGQRQRQAE